MSNPFPGASQQTFAQSNADAERITAFLRKVYGWMFVGLAVYGCALIVAPRLAARRSKKPLATGA